MRKPLDLPCQRLLVPRQPGGRVNRISGADRASYQFRQQSPRLGFHPDRRANWQDRRSAGQRRDTMTKILLVQGANLTFLGRREPDIYGTTTPAELDAELQRHAKKHGYQLDIFYTNVEGEAINRIYQAVDEGADGLVMNPAGFTYAGYALKDCIKGAGLPYVEVHISSIAKRNIHCVLSDAAEGMITGFGMHSYILGLDAMLEILRGRVTMA
jgi:3-dehydroquinate dehydratase II